MTTKNETEITKDIKKIIADSNDIEKDVSAYVKNNIRTSIEQSRKTGTSIKDAALNLLDATRDAFGAANQINDELVEKIARIITETTRESTEEFLKAEQKAADAAKATLDEALVKSRGDIEQVGADTREAVESAYVDMKEKTLAELRRLDAVGDAIYEYSGEKVHNLNERARPQLEETARKSKECLETIQKSTMEYSRKWLEHSRAEVAEWLVKMADNVNPKNDDEA